VVLQQQSMIAADDAVHVREQCFDDRRGTSLIKGMHAALPVSAGMQEVFQQQQQQRQLSAAAC
jgi:hypothetical protein